MKRTDLRANNHRGAERATLRKRKLARIRQARYRASKKGRAAKKAYEARPRVKEWRRQQKRQRRLTLRYRAQDLLDKARQRARKKVVKCTVTLQRIMKLLKAGRCQLSGLPLHFEPSSLYSRHPLAPSLHKKTPWGFYTDENMEIVSVALNTAFNEWGEDWYVTVHTPALKRILAKRLRDGAKSLKALQLEKLSGFISPAIKKSPATVNRGRAMEKAMIKRSAPYPKRSAADTAPQGGAVEK